MNPPLKHRVYRARLLDGEEFSFVVSSVREVSLREEIRKGEKLIDESSLVLVFETEDRNEALKITSSEF